MLYKSTSRRFSNRPVLLLSTMVKCCLLNHQASLTYPDTQIGMLLPSQRFISGILLFTAASSAATEIVRRLEDDSYFEYDLAEFSLRFEKCQYVKMFDAEAAREANSNTPFVLKHFAVFRLCPSDSCRSCNNVPHGQYVTDVQSYLKSTIKNRQEYLNGYCQDCNTKCTVNGDDQVDEIHEDDYCHCLTLCDRYQNLADYGYVDASNYIQCQAFQVGNNEEDGSANFVYIGPRCSSSGNRITIGAFSDKNCYEPLSNVDVEQLLGSSLSYHLLTQSYDSNDHICLSCREKEYDEQSVNDGKMDSADWNDWADSDNVNQMCEQLYNGAAKCESETGLTNGFIQMHREEKQYQNQVENEFMACTFINSLVWNSYTQAGEINVGAPQDVYVRVVTQRQQIALAVLATFILILLGVLEFFRRKIAGIESRVILTGPTPRSTLT